MQEQLGCRSVIIVSVPSEHSVVVNYLLIIVSLPHEQLPLGFTVD